LERYSEEGFGNDKVEESVTLDRGRWRKIIASPTPAWRENVDLNENDYDNDGNDDDDNR